MGDTIWLAAQALGTMVIVIGLAFVSWKQTRRMLANRRQKPSALARAVPDPQLRPDAEVRAEGSREHERAIDRAHAASVQHPSAVERLDGLVEPPDAARPDDAGAVSTARPRQAQ